MKYIYKCLTYQTWKGSNRADSVSSRFLNACMKYAFIYFDYVRRFLRSEHIKTPAFRRLATSADKCSY